MVHYEDLRQVGGCCRAGGCEAGEAAGSATLEGHCGQLQWCMHGPLFFAPHTPPCSFSAVYRAAARLLAVRMEAVPAMQTRLGYPCAELLDDALVMRLDEFGEPSQLLCFLEWHNGLLHP